MHDHTRRRLLLTALALIAYKLCFLVPLPTLASDAYEFIDGVSPWAKDWSVFALGLAPWVAGFLFVELFSYIVPWGRRARTFGIQGRKTLNQWAVRLSVVIAFFQAYAVSTTLNLMSTPNGAPVMYDSSWRRFVTVMTLLAGSTVIFGLARWISRHGFGNGFCWIFAAEIGLGWFDDPNATDFQLHEGSLTNLAAGLGFIAVFVYLFRHPTTYRLSTARSKSATPSNDETVSDAESEAQSDAWVGYSVAGLGHSTESGGAESGGPESDNAGSNSGEAGTDNETTWLPLPALPQGIVPLGWAYVAFQAWHLVGPSIGMEIPNTGLDLIPYIANLGLSIPVFGVLTLHLFSSRRRVEANLPHPVAVSPEFESTLFRRFLTTTVVLVLLAIVEALLGFYTETGFLVSLVESAFLAAMGIDIWKEWQFRESHPDSVKLVELDNVHLGLRLEGELANHAIPCLIQAARFRSLGFFLQPLYKMAVLVPADRVEESQALWDELAPEIL